MTDAIPDARPEEGSILTRRRLVGAAGAAVVGGALVATGLDRFLTSVQTRSTARLGRASFEPYLGEVFRASRGSSPSTPVRLHRVRDLLPARAYASRGREIDPERNFSIVFRGPLDPELAQGTYRFDHRALGRVHLFVVPMQADRSGRYYEAVFNRMREPSLARRRRQPPKPSTRPPTA